MGSRSRSGSTNLKKIAETARKAETDYASAAFILEQAHDELTTLYSRSEQLSLQYNQQTLQLDHQRETIGQLESRPASRPQNDIALLQSEIQHHRTNIARVQQELQDQQTRSGGIAGQIAAEQEKIAANDQELSEAEQALAQAQTQADALSRRSCRGRPEADRPARPAGAFADAERRPPRRRSPPWRLPWKRCRPAEPIAATRT